MFLTTKTPVSKVQGFYYSEAVPVDGAEDLLRRGRIEPVDYEAPVPAES